ncbi:MULTISPECIES: ABZJ_00895 family protein [Alphaproteobacteria]|uniref:ABZJ_00895 family protein n=1 Tax=Alphaproteobacteria TaxID=28211 RepID=UPI0012BB963D|nr:MULTISPECIES: ABZJ_00895 family protein [Alphaproteobacteria]MTH98675.1 hypothetical protein [Roseibium sp. RKSG952]
MKTNIVRFSLVYVGTCIAMPFMDLAAQKLLGAELPGAAAGMIPFMTAAMIEGQRYVKDHGEKPTTSGMWAASRLMALVGLVWSLLLAVVFVMVFPEVLAPLSSLPIIWMLVILGISFVLSILLCRLFIGLGAKNQLKQMARQHTRSS